MNNSIRLGVTGALVAAAALPSAALAQGHGSSSQSSASARTTLRVHRIDNALNKALDAIDNGDDATAVSKLSVVVKSIDRAEKTALAQVGQTRGPGSVALLASEEDAVAQASADALDGASADLTTALAGSLDRALDGRDALVAAITADTSGDYSRTASQIASDSSDEADAFNEGVASDDLTADGKTAETAAATQATATSTAAEALAGTSSADDSASGGDQSGGGQGCKHGNDDASDDSTSTSTDTTTAAATRGHRS